MASSIEQMSSLANGIKFEDYSAEESLFGDLSNSVVDISGPPLSPVDFADLHYDPPVQTSKSGDSHPDSSNSGDDSLEYSEIHSDIVLTYISKMLMEEDMEDKEYVHHGDQALQAAEKPFYEILSVEYPSPHQPPIYADSLESPDDSGGSVNFDTPTGWSTTATSKAVNANWFSDISGTPSYQANTTHLDYYAQSPFISLDDIKDDLYTTEGLLSSADKLPESFYMDEPILQFNKGAEEASKFLPDSSKFAINLDYKELSPFQNSREGSTLIEVKKEEEREHSSSEGLRGRKNPYYEDLDLEDRRSSKQSAIFSDEAVSSEIFDDILLCKGLEKCHESLNKLKEAKRNEAKMNAKNSTQKGANNGKSRGKKPVKKDVVDLRTLLIHCAQAVSSDDRRTANELLKQIRHNSSHIGDGSQRLADCFADGLEARLAGTGSQIFHSLMVKRVSAADVLKAYHLYMGACPFKKVSLFFANQTILNAADKAARLHIVDFGIDFGFQWPCLLQRLGMRANGPPRLRITGIDLPQPGFRPAERIEETGRRLADYAQRFGIPFEYISIASKWENVKAEDLKIEEDEVLVVNSIFHFRNLPDETVVIDSPRDMVLNNIRMMNPDVFIHGVMNGSYSAPFFVTRFREALFHFSAFFDMLDSMVPRHNPERLLIEREIFGREALNVIACEGAERVYRPETYKQWKVRNQRAGLTQIPLNRDLLKNAREKARSFDKEFMVDEDNKWLLLGWKGRITYALSAWRPSNAST